MQEDFSLESYDYSLPEKNIAQHPSAKRDTSKLLVLNRVTKEIRHRHFTDIIDYVKPGDILVVNDTKVFPARLFGTKSTGGKAEVFLLEFPRQRQGTSADAVLQYAEADVLVKSSKRPKTGSTISISDTLTCRVLNHYDNGRIHIELEYPGRSELIEILLEHGTIPLPPYITRDSGTSAEDRERYQTVYARQTGAVAAPTAGLHFTESVLAQLAEKGVKMASLTLHVGYGTFAPVRTACIQDHRIHREFVSLSEASARQINQVKLAGGKVWAVGTTTVRALEYCCKDSKLVQATEGWCDLYIIPGFTFLITDNLITNFHLPQSSLLFLVSALCGRETLLGAYREAIAEDYRFYSYGDAMAVIS